MISAYRTWLEHHSYSTQTVRSYLADLNKLLNWASSRRIFLPSTNYDAILSKKVLTDYLASIYQENSYSRHLASLKTFCQFALDQNLIPKDIFPADYHPSRKPASTPVSEPSQLLAEYQQWLNQQHASTSTVRNYLTDLKDYLSFTGD